MNKIKELFNQLTPYHHFLVFLIILTVLKIVNVFILKGFDEGLHFALMGVALIVISTLFHFGFSYLFDKNKKCLNSLISTFLILLMLSHADPEPVRGVLVIVFLYIAKFFIKYKGQNIFNPVVFAIGMMTLLALVVPFLGIPPMDFTGVDIRFPIMGDTVPLTILPLGLALLFNVARVKRHPLALSFIITSLLLGFFIEAYESDLFSYLIITLFVGAAVIIEPKSSPIKAKSQIIYGVAVAILIVLLTKLEAVNSIALAILLGNAVYFVSKHIKTSRS